MKSKKRTLSKVQQPVAELGGYASLLEDLKRKIQEAQTRAVLMVNREMVLLYWDIGRILNERQKREGWGAGVLSRLAGDLHNELPEVKGFSERNLKLMTQFYREYSSLKSIGQPVVAQLSKNKETAKGQQLVAQIPWAHNVLLMQKIKELSTRLWYMQKTIEQGWSRNVLGLMIESGLHKRGGKSISNFKDRLPAPQSDLVQQALKDPYIFDFLTLEEPFHERELEKGLIRHIEKFLIELGQGFAFVGRQYHMEVGESDFYIDLLFYHLKLRSYVVIELKAGKFKPEYAGQLNFYLSAIDSQLKHAQDNPTIGLILCKDKDRFVAEYALRDIKKPIGVANWQTKLVETLPKELKGSLPTIEEIEKELSR